MMGTHLSLPSLSLSVLKTENWFLQANPMKLVSRMKKIQEDISTLKGQCHELLAAKQVADLLFCCNALYRIGFEMLRSVFDNYKCVHVR